LILLLPLLLWLAAALLLLLLYRRDLPALWREPVLKRPLLIIESDDWGAGPAGQAQALGEIAAVLERYRDREGRHPVCTLALVLATAAGGRGRCVDIGDRRFADLREIMKQGRARGVFALQLHGGEHYWPPVLERAAEREPAVAAWLEQAPELGTESLPAPLQSRWIDASELPSRPLDPALIETAATDEVQLFQRCFGHSPAVAVPPTFIWTEAVERAWQRAGVEILVTPGRRLESRDGEGRPVAVGPPIRNLERGVGGLLYVVRDDYFEPHMDHTAAQALAALARKTRLGRPTLLETHRLNFLDAEQRRTALTELSALLEQALHRCPAVAFLSTEQLARAMESGDGEWVESSLRIRTRVFIERIWTLPRMRKLLWLTTLMLPVWLVWAVAGWSKPLDSGDGCD